MKINPKIKKRIQMNKEALEELFQVVTRLRTKEDAKHFFHDLFSSSEIHDIARRLKCAKLFYEKKTYQKIVDLLGMGPLTINKIHFKTKESRILPKLLL